MDSDPRIEREQALRKAVLRGDDAAWRVLYDAAFPSLYRFVHFRTGRNETWTEEAMQDCWMTAVRRIRDFRPKTGSFQSWLTGIAQNVLRNLHRKWARDRDAESLDSAAAIADSPIHDLELSEQIGVALTKLPHQYQTVLRARYSEQRSVAEIATASNQSFKAIESLLHRAREAFRQTYSQLNRDPREELPS